MATFIHSEAQQTVGLFLNDSLAFNGYTLIVPRNYNVTYLIDNCGEVVKTWTSNYEPGLSAYLLENGNLLRTARIPSDFAGSGGTGGRIEMFDWAGSLLWGYNYSSAIYHHHHDIAPMPNGNILLIAWELRSQQEAIEAGRDPNSFPATGLWSEQVVEIAPVGADSATIVWEWHLWDHLVQEHDASKLNFGSIAASPELLDLNFTGAPDGVPGSNDWIHINSIDYNAEKDQILLSSRALSEIWVIDHSTTSQEAAGHTGGNSGAGGDIIYRWGNPRTYGRGTASDQFFFSQHDAHWIREGLPDAGEIMVFNNGNSRPDGNYSSVDLIVPPLDSLGNYQLEMGQAFGPNGLDWTYVADPPSSFFSVNVSGAERQPNGNTLICNGTAGRIMEISASGDLVWDYVNPVVGSGPVSQGQGTNQNGLFRVNRYATDYPAFEGKDLTPAEPIELNPLPYECTIYEEMPSATAPHLQPLEGVRVFPNPVAERLTIENKTGGSLCMTIIDMAGRLVFSQNTNAPEVYCETSAWGRGLYVIYLTAADKVERIAMKLVKL